MLTLKKVAITGGLSSGKSSVCRILSELGAYVVDADAISHRLLSPDTPLGKEVQRLLGSDVVVNGHFDRAEIADRVFTRPILLSELEEILHPAIRAEISQEYQRVNQEGRYPLFVAEVPLLYESHWEQDFDVVVAVVTDATLAQRRYELKQQDNGADFDRRMKRQWSPERKAERADYVLNNNGSQLQLMHNVKTLFFNLCGGNNDRHHFLPLT